MRKERPSLNKNISNVIKAAKEIPKSLPQIKANKLKFLPKMSQKVFKNLSMIEFKVRSKSTTGLR